MSSFHVNKILGEFPELRQILTPQEVDGLSHATVERLGIATLNACASREHRFYIISKSGKLLEKCEGDGWHQVLFGTMTQLRAVVFHIGVDDIGYVAYVEDGNYDGRVYSHLTVLKLPQEGLREHLKMWGYLEEEAHLHTRS